MRTPCLSSAGADVIKPSRSEAAEDRVEAAAHATGSRPDLSCAEAATIRQLHGAPRAAAPPASPLADARRARPASVIEITTLALDPRKGRHGRSDRLARTRHVVLGRPEREIDDVSRQERRVVEHLEH